MSFLVVSEFTRCSRRDSRFKRRECVPRACSFVYFSAVITQLLPQLLSATRRKTISARGRTKRQHLEQYNTQQIFDNSIASCLKNKQNFRPTPLRLSSRATYQEYLGQCSSTAGRRSENIIRTVPVPWCQSGGTDTYRRHPSRKELHDAIKLEHAKAKREFAR